LRNFGFQVQACFFTLHSFRLPRVKTKTLFSFSRKAKMTKLSRKCLILTPILVHAHYYRLICFETQSIFENPDGYQYLYFNTIHRCLICFETGPRFVRPNYRLITTIILHSLFHLILIITRIRWSTAFLQLLLPLGFRMLQCISISRLSFQRNFHFARKFS
jgi:hypothetical protein